MRLLWHFISDYFLLLGITASGLFSQSAGTKPHAVRRTKSSPDLSQSNDDIKVQSNASNADTSGGHQERNKVSENNIQLKNFPASEYSQSQVTQAMRSDILHAFTIAFALSVHSVFEGLAFGLQEDMNNVCEYVLCMYVRTCAYVGVFICVYVCTCMFMCLRLCVYAVCIYVCICVYVYTYVHTYITI